MLTMDDMRFYVEPAVDQSINTGKLLVLDTFRESYQEQYIGKVVDVTQTRYETRGRNWWTTESGDYVFGAPVHSTSNGIEYGKPVIAPFGEGFVRGTFYSSGNEEGVQLTNIRHSAVNALSLSVARHLWTEWVVEAAPWASDCMPLETDTEESIAVKLELAKENYRQRRAFNYLHEQSAARGWHSDMDDVREKNSLIPNAAYSIVVTANVMVSMPSSVVGSVMIEAMQTRATNALANDSISTPTDRPVGEVGVMVQRKFKLPHRFPSRENLRTDKEEAVRTFWRDNIGVGRLIDFTHSTSLAGLAS